MLKFASTLKGLRVILSPRSHPQSIFQSRQTNWFHPQSRPNASESLVERRNVDSVKGTIQGIGLVSQKSWSPVMNVAAVVIRVPHTGARNVDKSSSGHPSCMELSEVGDVVRSYPWKCLECKTCEICLEKGDDVSAAFERTILPLTFKKGTYFVL